MHNKINPFLAAIVERHILSKPGTKRHTYHLTLDLAGSNLTYHPGDSIGVFPTNDPAIVAKTLHAMGASKETIVKEKNSGHELPLWEFLTHKANLGQFSRKLVMEVAARQTDEGKKEALNRLLTDAHHDSLKAFQEQHHVWDFLEAHAEATFEPQELCNLMMPLLPRLYSIASAQAAVGEEVHLTVSHLIYHSNGHAREGAATSYLCSRAPMHQPSVPVYVQPHHGFTLPEDADAPIIMVGPGTGVAPFRAFMQERACQGASGKNWLFFGEWNEAYDFFYEEFWPSVPNLRVTTAFSRDQAHKVYVQHRMAENGEEIYGWIQNGAYVYVCGDAQRMAKDVDAALHNIIGTYGNLDADGARKAVKRLRAEKRYLRDIY